MEPLLARIHQLNALFRQQLFQDITLPDVEAALSRIVSCNICFCRRLHKEQRHPEKASVRPDARL